VIERPRYSSSQQERILNECASTAVKRWVIESLESGWWLYKFGKERDNSREVVDKWNRIVSQFGAVLDALNNEPDIEAFIQSPARFREILVHAEERLGRQRDELATILAGHSANRDPHREKLYSHVLYTWTHIAGGKFTTSPSATKTGGPQARFFLASIEPVFSPETPKPNTLKSIFKRESDRRHGIREAVLSPELARAVSCRGVS
jgi:hypothetical protein